MLAAQVANLFDQMLLGQELRKQNPPEHGVQSQEDCMHHNLLSLCSRALGSRRCLTYSTHQEPFSRATAAGDETPLTTTKNYSTQSSRNKQDPITKYLYLFRKDWRTNVTHPLVSKKKNQKTSALFIFCV